VGQQFGAAAGRKKSVRRLTSLCQRVITNHLLILCSHQALGMLGCGYAHGSWEGRKVMGRIAGD